MHKLIFLGLALASAFAHSPDPAFIRCMSLLERTVERVTQNPEDTIWMQAPGIGNRGKVSGRYPPWTPQQERRALRQGIIPWFDHIAVAPDLETARALDERNIAYKQVMYMITKESIADLLPTEAITPGSVSPAEISARLTLARDRFRDLFRHGETQIVYFTQPKFDRDRHDEFDPLETKRPKKRMRAGVQQYFERGTDRVVPRDLVVIPPDDARRIYHADEMSVVLDDDGGVRFRDHGWFRLPLHGVKDFETTFARDANGKLESSVIARYYKLALEMQADGYRFTVNKDLDGTMALVKSMKHNVKGQEKSGHPMQENSRYNDPLTEQNFREQYLERWAFTNQLWGPDAELYGSQIGSYGVNRFLLNETPSGREAPRAAKGTRSKGVYSALDVRKVIMIWGEVWAYLSGYDGIDMSTVSSLTGELKTYYVTPEVFLARANAGPPQAPPHPDENLVLPTLEELFRRLGKD